MNSVEMSQKFVIINQERDGQRVPVSIPVTEFTALYTTNTVKLREIAVHFSITIPGVRQVADRLTLPSKAQFWQFKPKYNNIDVPRLRQLLEVDRLNYSEAGAALGISEYLVSRAVEGFDIKALFRRKGHYTQRDCIPANGRRICEFLPVCRQLEPSGEPLLCEVLLEDELPITEFERDSTPSLSYGAMPFCDLMR